jgi:hypothetical protein
VTHAIDYEEKEDNQNVERKNKGKTLPTNEGSNTCKPSILQKLPHKET